MKENYDKQFELICPTCGGKTFERDGEDLDKPITCLSCKKVFTREELLNANQENVDINLKEVQDEVMKDAAEEIRNMLKKTFKDS